MLPKLDSAKWFTINGNVSYKLVCGGNSTNLPPSKSCAR